MKVPALTTHLNLKNAIHVGHSTGGGEVVHYIARHGESRVAKAAILSAVPPLMVKTAANPGGLPKKVAIYAEISSSGHLHFSRTGLFKQFDQCSWVPGSGSRSASQTVRARSKYSTSIASCHAIKARQ